MALSHFHPLVSRWFEETLGEPTAAQRRGWAAIREGHHTLIAAPTGSGKTLAAFLTALDDLVCEAARAPLPDEVRVVYVSPLKALSADIHKNLAEPRRGIRRLAEELGVTVPRITAAVRTGDTSMADRAAMIRMPPHILVTTPESLYLLLTAERSREILRTARTVIVDEIHAVIGTRRGAHLALSLERLQQAADHPLVRLGLSATQKPIDEVARFLVGTGWQRSPGTANCPQEPGEERPPCVIVDEGHRREMDLALEIPGSPLEAVMSHEVWEDYYDRLAALVCEHRTTLVFVNTRRMAERIARHLSDRIGESLVTAHHGSLSKEKRLEGEARLKSGSLKALVATASLELGIDIGHVDLVCQIGSPHRIATLLQRVGRSGHTVAGMPKGRLFPVSRDDLVECAALMRAVRRGELDRIVPFDSRRDVLAQQIVAEASCHDYTEDELFALVRRAWPYRDLSRPDFDSVVKVAAEGFATRRGRRSALLHRDEVNGRVRGRRGARLLALTSGGAIPEVADYRVVLDPDDIFIGTVNEDFAIESIAGDIFQLGNASWRIIQVGSGVVRVADAKGAPPTIPFWLGEAPARSDELSREVSDLRATINRLLDAADPERSVEWLAGDAGISRGAAEQAVAYLAGGKQALGVLPTQETLVLERFFDESGGMQLVLHAPFGSRVNRAWGLALRKRFCRQFNFELQAAATEEGLLLSLGPQHSFPLADVFRYLHPATAREVLVQAFLDAPVFQTRWRWNTTISLAVPRNRNGRKVPPQLQRMLADDLMAAVFPEAAACLENVPGDREIPDHPLVSQTVRDCLQEAMDFDALALVLARIHSGAIHCVARDTPEPSPLSHEILSARPYAFLDDAPLEERRAQAVYTRRATEPSAAGDQGLLDPAAIARVIDEQRPAARDADELHDALLTAGFLTDADLLGVAPGLVGELIASHRAARSGDVWIAAERLPEWHAIRPGAPTAPALAAPVSRTARTWTHEDAVIEVLRGRLALVGPATAQQLAASLSIAVADVDAALLALESAGAVLRGYFTVTASGPLEWCDRSLLARIHRYTLNRLRAEIEPVSPADFVRFLFRWQHVDPATRLTGLDGLRAIVSMLDGFEAAAGSWERSILPVRMERYEPALLDLLCLTGEVGWARLSSGPGFGAPASRGPQRAFSARWGGMERRGASGSPQATEPGGGVPSAATAPGCRSGAEPRLIGSATPVALFVRDHADAWQALRISSASGEREVEPRSDAAAKVLTVLEARGATFFRDLAAGSSLDETSLERAIVECVSAGLVTSDGFAGLRAIVRHGRRDGSPRKAEATFAGRWSTLRSASNRESDSCVTEQGRDDLARIEDAAIDTHARAMLRRYGVVFRRLLTREANAAPWRLLTRVYRRLEARGEIRGGRFVAGMSGEQFALPDAVERLREARRTARDGQLLAISAADPLNLTGIVDAGDRVRATPANRIVYRDGVPLAAMEGDYLRPLNSVDPSLAGEVATTLAGRRVPAVVSGYVGR